MYLKHRNRLGFQNVVTMGENEFANNNADDIVIIQGASKFPDFADHMMFWPNHENLMV